MCEKSYEIAQICENGHVITIRYNSKKHEQEHFCFKCGAETFTKCERKAPKFIYGDISSLKNNDSISLFFIVLYF